MADQSPMKRWILTHATRVWTALLTLAGLGAAFVYRPELLTLYLRSTMTAIERGTAALPYPWGDRLEVVLRGIGGSVWMQFAFAIAVVRVIVWLIARFIGYLWRRRRRDPVSLGRPKKQNTPFRTDGRLIGSASGLISTSRSLR
jgi:hypothetical protein